MNYSITVTVLCGSVIVFKTFLAVTTQLGNYITFIQPALNDTADLDNDLCNRVMIVKINCWQKKHKKNWFKKAFPIENSFESYK